MTLIYASLGDVDNAMHWLTEVAEIRAPLAQIKVGASLARAFDMAA